MIYKLSFRGCTDTCGIKIATMTKFVSTETSLVALDCSVAIIPTYCNDIRAGRNE